MMWTLAFRDYGYRVPYIDSILLPLCYVPVFFKLLACIPGLWRFPIFACFFGTADALPSYVMTKNGVKQAKPPENPELVK